MDGTEVDFIFEDLRLCEVNFVSEYFQKVLEQTESVTQSKTVRFASCVKLFRCKRTNLSNSNVSTQSLIVICFC